MRKLSLFLIFTLGFILPSYAAPCYGTRLPGEKKFFGGFQTHTVFKRYLEDESGKLRSTQHFMLLSYGVLDWLSIDIKGGAGNIKQHPVGSDEVDYSSGFSGGYGFRLRLYADKKIKTVFGFQHLSVHPKKTYSGSTKHRAIFDDWQVSFLVSYDFSKIIPYLGTKWSRADYIHWTGDTRKRVMSDLTKTIGLVLGFDLPLNNRIWFNFEGQWFDTEALSVSMNFSF